MEAFVKYKWIDHDVNIIFQFANFWKQELFTDCTILCRGKKLQVHRLVLASCSEYFKEVFDNAQCCHPFIIMNDISSENLQILLDYIYQVNLIIPQKKLLVITEVGRALKIKGFEAPIKLVSNICSNVKSELVENLKLLQKSLSPVVSITKLDDVHSNISMKRKAPKEWDSEKKVRKVDDFACDVKVKVTKSFVQDEDSIPSKSSESCGLENFFEASDESDSDFLGFDDANRVQDEVAFNEEKKSHVESICDDVKPDFATLTNSLYLEVLNQRQDEECLDEEIVKEEEEEILPFPSEKSLLPNDSLPTIVPSTVNMEKNLHMTLPKMNNLFSENQIQKKREDIMKLIKSLSTEFKNFKKEPDTQTNSELVASTIPEVEQKDLSDSTSKFQISIPLDDNVINTLEAISLKNSNVNSLPQSTVADKRSISSLDLEHELSSLQQKRCHSFVTPEKNRIFFSPNKLRESSINRCISPRRLKSLKTSLVSNNIEKSFEVSSTMKKRKKKVKRPCFFCKKYQTDLSKHLLRVHKNETLVSEATDTPDKKKKNRILGNIRLLGIEKENELKLKRNENPICLKSQNMDSEKSLCLRCKGLFLKRTILRHEKNCRKKFRSTKEAGNLPLFALKRRVKNGILFHKDFEMKIIKKMRQDVVGEVIMKETLLQVIANDEFERIKGEKLERQTRKRVNAHTRRLALLFIKLKEYFMSKNMLVLEFKDMYNIENFKYLKNVLTEIIHKDQFKSGSAKLFDSSIKRSSAALIAHFRQEKQIEEKLTTEFLDHYTHNSCKIVGDSDFENFSRRCILRRAKNMPQLHEMDLLKSFILHQFRDLLNPFTIWDSHSYIRLRRVTVCRLTFFNGRRPAEVCELSVKEWELAKAEAYITDDQLAPLEKDDKELVKKFKVAFNMSKISQKEVTILIPESCFEALNILSDLEVRKGASVSPSNKFLFPSTYQSPDPTSGYHDILSICKSANLPKSLCSDQLRHHVSTALSNLDVDEETRKQFFKHMGHSKEISESVYAMPRALSAIMKIGPILKEIDDQCLSGTSLGDALLKETENSPSSPLSDPVNLEETSVDRISKEELAPIVEKNSPEDSNNMALKLKKRNKTNWTYLDKACIKKFFSKFLEEEKKSYPDGRKVEEFLLTYPDFLKSIQSPRIKRTKLRQQLCNMKRSIEMKYKKS